MGQEFHAKGANVFLGPGLNVQRIPEGGRNFEYLSGEDPYLGYILAQPAVKGIQDQKVLATAKHFVDNDQESERNYVDEIVDERTQNEIYYPPFEGAIQAGVGAAMCSYNLVNGV
jgi:beta-glucosidase